jgi:hypothetical protein
MLVIMGIVRLRLVQLAERLKIEEKQSSEILGLQEDGGKLAAKWGGNI